MSSPIEKVPAPTLAIPSRFESPVTETPEDFPPLDRRAYLCQRGLLWIMPASIGVVTALGFGYLPQSISLDPGMRVAIWWALWFTSIVGLGLLDAMVAGARSQGRGEIRSGQVLHFIGAQVFLVPCILLAGLLLAAGIKLLFV